MFVIYVKFVYFEIKYYCLYLINKELIRLNECLMTLLWRFFILGIILLITNNRARAPPDEFESKISIRSGGFYEFKLWII